MDNKINAIQAMLLCVADRSLACRKASERVGGIRFVDDPAEEHKGRIVAAEWKGEWSLAYDAAWAGSLDTFALIAPNGQIVEWVTLPIADVEARR